MECQKKIDVIWKKNNNCNNNLKYCDIITHSLKEQCSAEKDECVVSFKEAFDLNWNTLYIFDSMLYPEEVSKTLGVKYNGNIVPEGKSLFIFIENGKIVKEQISQCSGITFVKMKKDGVVKINYQEDYVMKRKILNGKVQYLLFEK